MSELIGIIGPPGSGKSTSIRTLDPLETFIINVAKKPLPIKSFKKNYHSFTVSKETGNLLNTSKSSNIVQVLKYIDQKRPEIKQIIIDDSNYIMSFSNMDKIDEVGFKKFTEMAKEFYNILATASDLRDDLKVFMFAHDENIGDVLNPKRKFKTIGRLLDNSISIEGLFTYIMFTRVTRDDESGKTLYQFETQNDGSTTAKTPMDCFKDELIPNDLQFVVDAINAYNE
jgi:hypothetical protein